MASSGKSVSHTSAEEETKGRDGHNLCIRHAWSPSLSNTIIQLPCKSFHQRQRYIVKETLTDKTIMLYTFLTINSRCGHTHGVDRSCLLKGSATPTYSDFSVSRRPSLSNFPDGRQSNATTSPIKTFIGEALWLRSSQFLQIMSPWPS